MIHTSVALIQNIFSQSHRARKEEIWICLCASDDTHALDGLESASQSFGVLPCGFKAVCEPIGFTANPYFMKKLSELCVAVRENLGVFSISVRLVAWWLKKGNYLFLRLTS